MASKKPSSTYRMYIDDTYLKSIIESGSNDIEKSHLNPNIKPNIEVINPEPSVIVIKISPIN